MDSPSLDPRASLPGQSFQTSAIPSRCLAVSRVLLSTTPWTAARQDPFMPLLKFLHNPPVVF